MNALCVFTSSMKSMDDGFPAALRLVEGRANVVITTLSFALGEINTGDVTLSRRERLHPGTPGRSCDSGDLKRDAAR